MSDKKHEAWERYYREVWCPAGFVELRSLGMAAFNAGWDARKNEEFDLRDHTHDAIRGERDV